MTIPKEAKHSLAQQQEDVKSSMSEHPTSPTAFSGLFKKESKVEDNWIEWIEGYAPLPPKTLVEVKFRNGEVREDLAEEWRWSSVGNGYDIVAYRILSPDTTELVVLRDMSDEEIDYSDIPPLTDEVEIPNKYLREYPYDTIDIYRVLQVYEVTDPCIQHAVKKLLCAGKRGYKEVEKDVSEAIQSLQRWEEMRKEEDGNSD